MRCPFCYSKTTVVESRTVRDSTIRRRKCLVCHRLFYTEESFIEYADGLNSLSKTRSDHYELKKRRKKYEDRGNKRSCEKDSREHE